MKRKLTAKRWTLALAGALALGALILAGCGGSSGGSSSGSGSTTTTSSAGGSVTFEISDEARACLKAKGVELPGVKVSQGGPPQGEEGFRPPPGGELPESGESPGGAPSAGAGGPGGEQFEETQKAFEECGVDMPQMQGPGGRKAAPVKSAVFRKQVREYAACVRKNGYELAEPNFSGDGPVFKESESESAAFKRASAKCQSLLRGPRGGPGSEGENGT